MAESFNGRAAASGCFLWLSQKDKGQSPDGSPPLSLRAPYSRCGNLPLLWTEKRRARKLKVTQLVVNMEARLDPEHSDCGAEVCNHHSALREGGSMPPGLLPVSYSLRAVPAAGGSPEAPARSLVGSKGGTSPKTFPARTKELRIGHPATPTHHSRDNFLSRPSPQVPQTPESCSCSPHALVTSP